MSSQKTIGIDARMYGDGFGLARYTKQLLQDIEPLTQFRFVVFLRREAFDLYHPAGRHIVKVIADIPWYTVKEQQMMPGVIRESSVHLMHFPHWNVPLLYRGPFVVTIHDLIMYHFPRPEATTLGPLAYKVKDFLHRLVVQSAANRAEHILATASFTKDDIIKTLGISDENISVLYQRATMATSSAAVDIKDIYDIQRPYVLFVGSAYPHKNLSRLLEAWKNVHKEFPSYELLLVGKDSPFYDRLEPQIEKTPAARHLGFVPDEELALLYKQATAYVIPSLYEGFGLPPLEAMQYGVPVLAARASCLPEVLGHSALYVDGESSESIANGMKKLLNDHALRKHFSHQGQERLMQYAQSMTHGLEQVYTKAIKNPTE